jgi:GNAT superfamily N-acetyltransferase
LRLRDLQPGDAGWVIQRHGALYAAEHGLDGGFELDVADIVVQLLRRFTPGRDFAVIAEIDGVPVGSAFVVGHAPGVAKLRLVIVDPAARGHGVGRQLVEAALGFARGAGYQRMTLWTMQMLTAARHIYATSGFRLIRSVPTRAYGRDVVDETWEIDLLG